MILRGSLRSTASSRSKGLWRKSKGGRDSEGVKDGKEEEWRMKRGSGRQRRTSRENK
jgi:hypothetical protein